MAAAAKGAMFGRKVRKWFDDPAHDLEDNHDMTRKNPVRSRRGNHRDLGGIGRQEVIACQVRRGVFFSLSLSL